MPYINQKRRKAMLADEPPQNAGELNYCLTWHMIHTPVSVGLLEVAITAEIEDYLSVRPESYALYNEVVGALECCRREYKRRSRSGDGQLREFILNVALSRLYDECVAPYESTKIEENGDVY